MKKAILSKVNHEISTYLRGLGVECSTAPSVRPDALILPGGADVRPELYHAAEDRATMPGPVREDLRELALIFEARALKIPIIGICRGIQILHVSYGGSLVQDILGHRGTDHNAVYGTEEMEVNSTHHQCVPFDQAEAMYEEVWRSIADTSRVASQSEEIDTTEAIWSPSLSLFAVQYHPERQSCPKSGRDYFEKKFKELLKL